MVPKVGAPNARDYLDQRAAAWLASPPPIANVPCALSCHTTLPYLLAAPASPVRDELRAALVRRVDDKQPVPWYGTIGSVRGRQSIATENVLDAVALMLDDEARGTEIQPVTRRAIARMWSSQRADGGWDWLDFSLEPWQAGEDWGAAMAMLVAGRGGVAPPGSGARLTRFLRARLADRERPMKLHDRAALLWTAGPTLASREVESIARAIDRTQHSDGGFSLLEWTAAAPMADSDGYATALAVLALCRAPDGGSRDDVRRGIAWLRKHQAADGTWPGQSANSRTSRARRFMTDAATAYASLALATCG
jgi:squalene-hopene/tetraprenyl-beta-curcumene cyclase